VKTAKVGSAGFVYDLRNLFPPAVYDADPATDADTDSGSAGGPQGDDEGTDAREGGTGSADDGTGDAASDDKPIKDPEKKRLSDEAAAHRIRAKKAEEALTAANTTIQELRLHNAFMRAALPLVDDLDATWKLCDHSLAKIDDDGNVTGMDTMITAALRSYPYLERVVDTMPLPVTGGMPSNGRRSNPNAATAAMLEKKYRALRRR
jgi:hypothetical protein